MNQIMVNVSNSIMLNDTDCQTNHQKLVIFDSVAAKGLDPTEIQKRWPRFTCPECQMKLYASMDHYVAGNW